MLSTIKKIFLWTYARTTWQWDVLCVLILAFIFLTPKSWFQGSERRAELTHQNRVTATVLVGSEVVDSQGNTAGLRDHVRILTGRAEAEVIAVRRVTDKNGVTVGYQVDIR